MINELISAISIAINKNFGDSYDIYREAIEQGFNCPCFSIICVDPAKEQQLGNSYLHSNIFCVHYFPPLETSEKRRECYQVADELANTLEYITVNGILIRGIKMHSEITEGVLHFFVEYNTHSKKIDENVPMENLETISKVKG